MNYLNEINREVESAKEEHEKLSEENSQYKDEIVKSENKRDSLQKELDTNRLNFNKDLDSLSKVEKELVQKIEVVDANIQTAISDRTKIETVKYFLNLNLSSAEWFLELHTNKFVSNSLREYDLIIQS